MTILTYFLRTHLEKLLEHDSNFQRIWHNMSIESRKKFIRQALKIQQCCNDEHTTSKFMDAHFRSSRALLTVQQRDFEHTKLPKDWPVFIVDESKRKTLFEEVLLELSKFMKHYNHIKHARIYGGIKNLRVIDSGRLSQKQESKIQQSLEDTWDAVRFRIVTSSLKSLEHICLDIWRNHFDSVLRCRNYYYFPKAGSLDHPYRAIHFQISHINGYPFELQVMTEASELISHLDHPVLFKRKIHIESEDHITWLNMLRKKALIHDTELLAKKTSKLHKLGIIRGRN